MRITTRELTDREPEDVGRLQYLHMLVNILKNSSFLSADQTFENLQGILVQRVPLLDVAGQLDRQRSQQALHSNSYRPLHEHWIGFVPPIWQIDTRLNKACMAPWQVLCRSGIDNAGSQSSWGLSRPAAFGLVRGIAG